MRGYAAIDAARNQMASDALAQGFAELMWIDAYIVFDPNDVGKLRRYELPVVCGIYPKVSVHGARATRVKRDALSTGAVR